MFFPTLLDMSHTCKCPLERQGTAAVLACSGIPQHGYGAEHHFLALCKGAVILELPVLCMGHWCLELGMGERALWMGTVLICLPGDSEAETGLDCSLWFRHHVQTGRRREIHGLETLSGIMAFR